MKKNFRYHLGVWQIQALKRITSEGRSAHELVGNITGDAKKWRRKYFLSLRNAVVAHNNGRAKNSPLPYDCLIQSGFYGPCGEYGYRVVPMKAFPGLDGVQAKFYRLGHTEFERPGLRGGIGGYSTPTVVP